MKSQELRSHQRTAVEAVAAALADGGRAQAVMAMGTGKTLVGRAAADRLLPDGGTVAVLVPSLALVSQSLRTWRMDGTVRDVLVVCSLDDPGGSDSRADDAPEGLAHDDERQATTDPATIADWLAAQRPGLRLLIATYHSVPRITEAFASRDGLPPLGMIVFDEAHRAAAHPAAPFATALHDQRIPAVRRLFLTATPRLEAAGPDQPGEDAAARGMSDETLFGPRVYTLDIAEAIEQGLLCDYRAVLIGVTDAEAHKLVLDNAPMLIGAKQAEARTVAVQIALARAAREYGLRRVLVFHNRVVSSRDFAAVLPDTVAAMPGDLRPDGYLTAHHVDAGSSPAVRRQVLEDLAEPESDGWTVVSNVQVFGEGVDCPALDSVVFADPREGQANVVQAIGRALRLHPERDQPAIILIPVYLSVDDRGDVSADDSAFRSVWQILRALREHDQRVGTQLSRARRGLARTDQGRPEPDLPDWIDLRFPADADESFLTAFSAHMLDGATDPYEHGLARLQEFARRHGHSCPEQLYVDETGFRLGGWTAHRRQDRTRGLLDPALAAELEALPGWSWNLKRAKADRMFALLEAYAAEHGHTRPPPTGNAPDGVNLGDWVSRQRDRYRKGALNPDVTARLERIPGWTWKTDADERWEECLDHLRAYARQAGHADVTRFTAAPDGTDLGSWVARQRVHRTRMPRDRARALEAVPGWGWTKAQAHQERMLAEVTRYYADHGPGLIPKNYHPAHAPELAVGRWVSGRHREFSAGQLPEDLAARLTSIPGFTWPSADSWFRGLLSSLAAYAHKHGSASPPKRYVTADGFPLGSRTCYLRGQYHAGKLPADRVRALEALPGWTWEADNPERAEARREEFALAIRALHAYAAENGHCALPRGSAVQTPDGRDLETWMRRKRTEYRRGHLTHEQIAAFEAIPGWFWDRSEHLWEQGLSRLRAYAAEHGTADVPRAHLTADGFQLGSWVHNRRTEKSRNTIRANRVTVLESLPGWRW